MLRREKNIAGGIKQHICPAVVFWMSANYFECIRNYLFNEIPAL